MDGAGESLGASGRDGEVSGQRNVSQRGGSSETGYAAGPKPVGVVAVTLGLAAVVSGVVGGVVVAIVCPVSCGVTGLTICEGAKPDGVVAVTPGVAKVVSGVVEGVVVVIGWTVACGATKPTARWRSAELISPKAAPRAVMATTALTPTLAEPNFHHFDCTLTTPIGRWHQPPGRTPKVRTASVVTL